MMITDKLFYTALLIVVLAVVINTDVILRFLYKNSFKAESSVWCSKGSKETNLCKFKNICYDPQFKTLLFFLNNKTIINGISHYKDLQKIQLSSVYSHNQFYANLSVIDTTNYRNKKQILLYQKVFLFSRFKPDNLMHSIHDDLFPLFLTLESACLGEIKCMEKYHLIMFDHYPRGPYFELYRSFSNHPPVVVSELVPKANVLCFEEVLTGLIQDGIFFQYGFGNGFQGPVKTNLLSQSDIHRFKTFIQNKLKIENIDNNINSVKIVLISRKKSRKILNVNQVEELIESAFKKLTKKKFEINILNLQSYVNVIDLIKVISNADVVIGMHGAEMILSLFLKPDSIVFEIFPFGIQPDAVSFIKPISELENSQLVYFSWRNRYRNHSVTHVNAHPLLGGITHLDKALQEKIKTISEIPPVKCCNDPLYLHYMYQDTLVSNEFGDFLYKSLSEFYSHQKQTISEKIIKKWFYPNKIISICCRFHSENKQLNITWQPPFNVNSHRLLYRLYVKDVSGKFENKFSTDKLSIQLDVPFDIVPKFQLWISVYYDVNDSESPDLYVECS